MQNKNKYLIAIIGPTAVGKTAVAIAVAKHFYTEIISSDSRQIYSEMNIGTAKPSNDELKEITHHFIGNVSIQKLYSAGDFEREVLKKINDLFIQKNVVVMAGGSGLYIKALCEGLREVPGANEKLRDELQKLFDEKGIEPLQKMLKELNAEKYSTIDIRNTQRVMRAIEVAKDLNLNSKINLQTSKRNFNIVKIGITLPREILYDRINQRVDKMIGDGFVEEAKNLYQFKHLNALQTVGYNELFDYFDGKYSLQYAIEKIKQHTRNFAKRQTTWFRKEKDVQWFEPDNINKIINCIETQTNFALRTDN